METEAKRGCLVSVQDKFIQCKYTAKTYR